MNFVQLQDAVKSDRFREAQRGDIQTWINARYWWLWSLEDWPFRYATDTITVTAGGQSVTSLPDDFGKALAVIATDDSLNAGRLSYKTPGAFFEDWYLNDESGVPSFYTIVDGDLFVGPTPDSTAADYKLVYLREFTMLAADDDEPALPAGAHLALVFGGSATGLKLQNDPTWQAFEQDFNSAIQVLRAGYLHDAADLPARWPGDDLC